MKNHPAHTTIEQRVPPESKVLNIVAQEVPVEKITAPPIQSLIDAMFEAGLGRQGDAKFPTVVGLAAPQIGVSKRIVLIGVNAAGSGTQPELREFINPESLNTRRKQKRGVRVVSLRAEYAA